jgi:Family of unknown function (DUF5681)
MADGIDPNKPYEVGYGKPPKRTQFTPGKSGNPSGHKNGKKNFATVLGTELNRRFFVNEEGRRKKITKREAIAKQLVNKAASGDPKAIPVLLNETRFHEAEAAAGPPSVTMAQEDHLVMANIVRRIREATPVSPEPSDAETPSSPLEGDPPVPPTDEREGES